MVTPYWCKHARVLTSKHHHLNGKSQVSAMTFSQSAI